MMAKLLRTICVIGAIFTLAGCGTFGGNMLSTHDEVLLGVSLMKEVESQELLHDDTALQDYVDDVGRRLVRVAKRQHIPYTFRVLSNDETVDAFALPGGYFYVTTGFLRACSNEAELAGMMAHELAHVITRHHGEVLSREYGARLVQGQILGSDAIATRRMILDIMNYLTVVEFNERQEREADEISVALMIRAGYDPRALPSILLKLYEAGVPLENQADIFTGSFQPTPERVDRLYEMSLDHPEDDRNGIALFEERYREKALSRLK